MFVHSYSSTYHSTVFQFFFFHRIIPASSLRVLINRALYGDKFWFSFALFISRCFCLHTVACNFICCPTKNAFLFLPQPLSCLPWLGFCHLTSQMNGITVEKLYKSRPSFRIRLETSVTLLSNKPEPSFICIN